MTERLTREQAFLCMAVSGATLMELHVFQRMAAERLGRPVLTHDMKNEQFWNDLRSATLDDFEKIVPK